MKQAARKALLATFFVMVSANHTTLYRRRWELVLTTAVRTSNPTEAYSLFIAKYGLYPVYLQTRARNIAIESYTVIEIFRSNMYGIKHAVTDLLKVLLSNGSINTQRPNT
jgi:hypothetical protein